MALRKSLVLCGQRICGRLHGMRREGCRVRADRSAASRRQIRAIHPFGKMPVLRHDDVELCESKAIATWLDAVSLLRTSFPPTRIKPHLSNN